MQPPSDSSTDSSPTPAAPNSVLKSAALMSLGTLTSRILGLVRDLALAALFPRLITDVYVVAFRLPNLFRRVLGEGSLAASFVPVYVGKLKDPQDAERFSRAIFTLLSLVTATLTALGIIFMEPILQVLVSGENYQSVPGKFELTLQMARIMFGFLFLVMTYAFLASVLNAHRSFFLPAVAPAGFNFLLVCFTIMPHFNFPGDQLAWGVIAGGLLQLLMVVIPLVKVGRMPKPSFDLWVPGMVVFFRNFIPSLIGMSVMQILALMNVMFASRLEQGAHSYIYLADRLLEFPQSLLSVSLGVALLPTLSELWSQNKVAEMLKVSTHHLRLLLFLSLPSAVGLFMLADPIVRVVYMRGEFDAHDAFVTAQVLKVYAVVLVLSGMHRVLVPSFYAIKNTWLPATLGAIAVGVHYFVADFGVEHWGILGLVGATAFTGFLNLLMLLVFFQGYFGSLGYGALGKSALHLLPSLIAMGLVCGFIFPAVEMVLGLFIGFVFTFFLAIVIFFAVNKVLRHPEADEILGLVARRLR